MKGKKDSYYSDLLRSFYGKAAGTWSLSSAAGVQSKAGARCAAQSNWHQKDSASRERCLSCESFWPGVLRRCKRLLGPHNRAATAAAQPRRLSLPAPAQSPGGQRPGNSRRKVQRKRWGMKWCVASPRWKLWWKACRGSWAVHMTRRLGEGLVPNSQPSVLFCQEKLLLQGMHT